METLNFVPIQTLDIEAEKQITFDLYLNLPMNQKVILYRHKGGELKTDRFEKLISRDAHNFCIRKDDLGEFVRYVANRLKLMIEDRGNGHSNPQMMASSARSILSSTFQAGNSAMALALMGNLNEITGVLIESVLENISPGRKKAFRKLLEMSSTGSDFHKHPINVTSLSVMIAFGIGYSTDKILTEVAMGSLLHDIGLARLPEHVAQMAHQPQNLSHADRQQLYRHGEYALDILKEKNIPVSEVLRAIVTQHHEQFNGSGYPLKLRGHLVNEFAQIVRVADDLDYLIRDQITDAQSLRKKVTHLFAHLQGEKVTEPGLGARIRGLFLEI